MTASRLAALIRRAPVVGGTRPPRRRSGAAAAGYRVYLVRTVTGQLGPAVDPAAGSWAIDLNGTESGSLTLRKSELTRLPLSWLTPWYSSVLVTYVHDGVERPVVAGPITGWPAETDEELTVDFSGIRRILDYRYAMLETPLDSRRDVVLTGLSWGSIAWEVVTVALSTTGGSLPIVHGSPYEVLDPGHDLVLPWYDLGNNNTDQLLTRISDTADGPDLMFRPRWADPGHRFISWAFVHGTAASPVIAQDRVPDWDTTAARGAVESLTVRSSADVLASRVWATGAGEGTGTVLRAAEDLAFVHAGGPMLERHVSHTSETTGTAVASAAAGELQRSGDMVDQLSLVVRADSAKAPAGAFHVGDSATVTVRHRLSIPDGTHRMRLIKAAGDLTTHRLTLDFQEDAW